MCRKGGGSFADPAIFGKKIGGVPSPAVDAYYALEAALRSAGYAPRSVWAYNCRSIASSGKPSLHSAGIAVDIDPKENPFTPGDKHGGKLKPNHVAAVLAIKNTKGTRVWAWGGDWSKPDRMHFQLDVGPTELDINWSTVPGGRPSSAGKAGATAAASAVSTPTDEEEQVLTKGAGGEAVTHFQKLLLAWDPKSLPKYGADGDYGTETINAVKAFQTAMGLEPTGNIDGVTAAVLAGVK
jgi:peptidoglycan hydrolase-like protein with peptidoglycan-binding domain